MANETPWALHFRPRHGNDPVIIQDMPALIRNSMATPRLFVSGLILAATTLSIGAETRRPPAVPLIAHDPYFSVWSTSNELYGGTTRHWTGRPQSLTSLVRIDGKTSRLMGEMPVGTPGLPQVGLQVLPTRTIYTFRNNAVEVKLSFVTPTLPDNLEVLSRPATYLVWEARSVDQKKHDISVYFDAGAELAVNNGSQKVKWDYREVSKTHVLRVGSVDQPVLGASGDDLRIDWGHLYLSTPKQMGKQAIGARPALIGEFTRTGNLPTASNLSQPRAANDGFPALALAFPFGSVDSRPSIRHAILAYDDEYSIQFFGQNLRPYWRRKGMDAIGMIAAAERDYGRLLARCEKFDNELMGDLTKAGGANYAYLGALAYRQSFAAQKVVADRKGQPLMFSKENFSNGCIGTVDVLYPAAPALLLFSPSLMKASLAPLLEYSASSRWKFPFAPHDLGTYPLANGQVYGGGERTEDNQMPVEESGNILILLAALAKQEGNADFSAKYWPQISAWAKYLADKGFDPESQLSTDDFAGHLAHNVNLSAKAIVALDSYAYLCEVRGLNADAAKYRNMARSFATRWVREANDGEKYRLAFDRPGTWSQKYNLVWDRLLGFKLFPASVARKEMDFYLKHQNKYGLPLDNRRDYTKLDWIVWTGTLTGRRDDFTALIDPIVDFLDATPDRAPMPDWFQTIRPRKEGFQARSVVGGVFIKLLESPEIWQKYASRDKLKVGGWAPIPKPPIVTPYVPTSEQQPIEWAYTTDKPADNWFSASFDTSAWKRGPAGFGTEGTPGAVVRTRWNTSDIWIRREFELQSGFPKNLEFLIHHDEDAEVYVNGVLAGRFSGYVGQYAPKPINAAGLAALRPGRNVIAIHCHQTTGGQYIDAGFATVKHPK